MRLPLFSALTTFSLDFFKEICYNNRNTLLRQHRTALELNIHQVKSKAVRRALCNAALMHILNTLINEFAETYSFLTKIFQTDNTARRITEYDLPK